jgi:hypothetical protein
MEHPLGRRNFQVLSHNCVMIRAIEQRGRIGHHFLSAFIVVIVGITIV